jgi:hypothetical protein
MRTMNKKDSEVAKLLRDVGRLPAGIVYSLENNCIHALHLHFPTSVLATRYL